VLQSKNDGGSRRGSRVTSILQKTWRGKEIEVPTRIQSSNPDARRDLIPERRRNSYSRRKKKMDSSLYAKKSYERVEGKALRQEQGGL